MERILWKHNLNVEALKILSVIVADKIPAFDIYRDIKFSIWSKEQELYISFSWMRWESCGNPKNCECRDDCYIFCYETVYTSAIDPYYAHFC